MGTRLPGFKGEYLWEFDIADRQLSALAEAFPAERYGWRTAETARSVSEILVYVAAVILLSSALWAWTQLQTCMGSSKAKLFLACWE